MDLFLLDMELSLFVLSELRLVGLLSVLWKSLFFLLDLFVVLEEFFCKVDLLICILFFGIVVIGVVFIMMWFLSFINFGFFGLYFDLNICINDVFVLVIVIWVFIYYLLKFISLI